MVGGDWFNLLGYLGGNEDVNIGIITKSKDEARRVEPEATILQSFAKSEPTNRKWPLSGTKRTNRL